MKNSRFIVYTVAHSFPLILWTKVVVHTTVIRETEDKKNSASVSSLPRLVTVTPDLQLRWSSTSKV